tara:strand:+ start:121546 stop:122550 length:1005 start_codon:yes stop_codon:yes gene_type:complete
MRTIDQNGDDASRQILAGDSGGLVDVKVYQAIYNQLTGKSEKATDRYTDNIVVDFDDVRMIYEKIHQSAKVHNVIAENFNVTFFHLKNKKSQFSSYEKMMNYDRSYPNPIISIVLKFHYSIILPEINKPQEYIVTARIMSRVAKAKQVNEDSPPFMRGRFFPMFKDQTAEISVEYVDYIVARTFLDAFRDWMESCTKITDPKFISFLQKWSFLSTRIGAMIGLCLSAMLCIQFADKWEMESYDLLQFYQFLAGSAVFSFFLFTVFIEIFRIIEMSIDSFPIMSYLKVNKGDIALISDVERSKNKIVWKMLSAIVFPIFLGVVASQISSLIDSFQ